MSVFFTYLSLELDGLIGLDFDNKCSTIWLKAESFGWRKRYPVKCSLSVKMCIWLWFIFSWVCLEPVSTFGFYIPQKVYKISRDSTNKFIMLFCISEQGTSVIKWNIYDEYKIMQIHLFAWKLACYLSRFIFEL